MQLLFSVSARIAKPVSEVFEAVADPAKLSRYFTTGGAKGRLETGATVMWDFHDFPGAFPVEVVDVEKDRRIVLRWEANRGTGAGWRRIPARLAVSNDGDHDLRAFGRRPDARHHQRGRLAPDAWRPQSLLRQQSGLDAHAMRPEGQHRIRHNYAMACSSDPGVGPV